MRMYCIYRIGADTDGELMAFPSSGLGVLRFIFCTVTRFDYLQQLFCDSFRCYFVEDGSHWRGWSLVRCAEFA